MQTRLNAQANELMLLSFQREQFEEALQKSNTKPLKRMGNFQNDPTLEEKPQGGEKKQTGLFLKNGSKVLPPRRAQLPVSNSEIEVDDGESGIE